MQRDDVVSLSRRLLWGTASTRQQLAEQLAPHGCGVSRALLVETARSDEPWLLRARCLEVLGLVAGQAEQPVAEEILALLFRAPLHAVRDGASAVCVTEEASMKPGGRSIRC